MERWTAGSHGTTFGGNPVSCAAALATLDVLEDEHLLTNCRVQGERLLTGARKLHLTHPAILDARGVGLMVALEFAGAREAMQVLQGCLARGLLLYSGGRHGQVVRMIPPLCVSSAEVDEALAVVEEALQAVRP